MAVKAVIFDCFGVLIMPMHSSLVHDFPHLTTQLEDLRHRSDRGYITRVEFDQALSNLTHIPAGKVEDAYWDKNTRNASAFEWLAQLKQAHQYKIGLLSNIGKGWLDDFLPETERRQLFDDEVLSGLVGMAKPDPAIFQLMADRLGVDPAECVMIDDLPEYLVGAKQIGMQTIVFTSTDQAKKEFANLEKA
jgi:putative hydrolase of the HAD superfamily